MVILWYYNGIIIEGRAAEMPQNSEISVVAYKKAWLICGFTGRLGGICVFRKMHIK